MNPSDWGLSVRVGSGMRAPSFGLVRLGPSVAVRGQELPQRRQDFLGGPVEDKSMTIFFHETRSASEAT
jgi:hypothetical protein